MGRAAKVRGLGRLGWCLGCQVDWLGQGRVRPEGRGAVRGWEGRSALVGECARPGRLGAISGVEVRAGGVW